MNVFPIAIVEMPPIVSQTATREMVILAPKIVILETLRIANATVIPERTRGIVVFVVGMVRPRTAILGTAITVCQIATLEIPPSVRQIATRGMVILVLQIATVETRRTANTTVIPECTRESFSVFPERINITRTQCVKSI